MLLSLDLSALIVGIMLPPRPFVTQPHPIQCFNLLLEEFKIQLISLKYLEMSSLILVVCSFSSINPKYKASQRVSDDILYKKFSTNVSSKNQWSSKFKLCKCIMQCGDYFSNRLNWPVMSYNKMIVSNKPTRWYDKRERNDCKNIA